MSPASRHCVYRTLVKESEMLVAQSCLTLCDPMDCSPPGSSVLGILQARILEWGVGCHALLQGTFLSQGLHLESPALQADSFPSEPPGKPQVKFR